MVFSIHRELIIFEKGFYIMQATNFNNAIDFITSNSKAIDEVRVTSIKRYGFNCYEGYQVDINVKLLTNSHYKNKLFTIMTNDTYMEDFDRDNEKESFQEYLNIIAMD